MSAARYDDETTATGDVRPGRKARGRLLRPRSISALVLLGFVLVTMPLITALVAASIQVERLARHSQRAVLEAEATTHASRALAEHLTAMERSIAQYNVLGDAVLYAAYASHRNAFLEAADDLVTAVPDSTFAPKIEHLLAAERGLYERFSAAVKASRDIVEVSEAFAPLFKQTRAIRDYSNRLIERQAGDTITVAREIKQRLLVQAAAVIPTAIVLTALFAVLITRSTRQIDHAIRRLGNGDFARPIRITGPDDIEELGRALDWLRLRIVELENQKSEFLRHISHEFKTPLTSITEGAELLMDDQRDGLSEENRQIVQILRNSSAELHTSIDNLLDFARLQSPIAAVHAREPVQLHTLVERVLESHALTTAAKDIDVQRRLDEVITRGDASQLRAVVDNLVSNAIKYTPSSGRIMVTLACAGRRAVLSVEDSGPGVHPDDRARVFEPFFQGRHVPRSHVRGTGLGLSIAKKNIEAHDGTIEIVDGPAGAHFRVSIPLANAR